MNDLRVALRQLRKAPAFTVTALATVAICLGANLAIFAVIDSILLRPLPFPDSEKILTLSQTVRSTGVASAASSPANYLDWLAQNDVFSLRLLT